MQAPLTLAAQEVDAGTASTIIGGATVDIQNLAPNATLERDQIYVKASVTHALAPGQVIIDQNTGNGKNWSTTVSTRPIGNNQEQGSWISSMNYPLTNNRGTFSVRVCNRNNGEGANGVPCSIVPNGDANLANIGLDPRLRVTKVWFHSVRDNGEATVADEARMRRIVDYIDNGDSNVVEPTGRPSGLNFNADDILASCRSEVRLQLRFYAHDIVDANGWLPASFNFTRFKAAYSYDGISSNYLPTQFVRYVQNIDPQRQYFHVFFVNQMFYNTNDTGRIIGRANAGYGDTPGVSFIAIEDDAFNEMSFRNAARLLVHEFGHEASQLEHYYWTEECRGIPSSNVMCPIIGGSTGAGDSWGFNPPGINGAQCDLMYIIHNRLTPNQYR
ncbi:MAG: hypothetical protein Q8R10_19955 [Pseudomonas sp.]|uniref:hypothetical protein n=1 Tax=Pseudomonas sp. TaxID=306 RepID=UPI002735DC42|nr:hypothetical protein [Pseudomonas sp.]MDP3848699.1 hypothetical protein [Pseudomonas sp.]